MALPILTIGFVFLLLGLLLLCFPSRVQHYYREVNDLNAGHWGPHYPAPPLWWIQFFGCLIIFFVLHPLLDRLTRDARLPGLQFVLHALPFPEILFAASIAWTCGLVRRHPRWNPSPTPSTSALHRYRWVNYTILLLLLLAGLLFAFAHFRTSE